MSAVEDELRPSFSSSRVTVTCDASSRNAEMPSRTLDAPDPCARTARIVPACLPFVIHCFWPEISQPSPSRVAAVRRAAASEPAPGSVSANAPSARREASGGTNRSRCSFVPHARIGSVVALVWTATVTPTPASARDSSSSTRMYERKSAPAPPYSSGTHTPIRPELAEPCEHLAREAMLAIPLGRVRRDLRIGELARERLDLALLPRQLEVHFWASI